MTALWRNTALPEMTSYFLPSLTYSRRYVRPFSLPENQKLVLYAPTFRSDHSNRAYNLDVPSLLDACHTRFGGSWSCLVRLHPNVAKHSTGLFAYNGSTILDATAYPDMQELLYAVDMLISDYSSCMFDFALSGKPCLQFATDIESYRQDRNFYFPWTAFPSLCPAAIRLCVRRCDLFDAQEYARNWAAFAQENHFLRRRPCLSPLCGLDFGPSGQKGENAMKRVITYGTFDLLHYGHINLLRRAKALGGLPDCGPVHGPVQLAGKAEKKATSPTKSAKPCWKPSAMWTW